MSDLKFKGTKGNWFVSRDHGCVVSDTEDKEGFSETTGHIDKEYYGGLLICESIWKKADAHIIAASKDLLEALQSIENDDGHIPEPIWELRNKAIKKALNI